MIILGYCASIKSCSFCGIFNLLHSLTWMWETFEIVEEFSEERNSLTMQMIIRVEFITTMQFAEELG